jgi:hypothetical protein
MCGSGSNRAAVTDQKYTYVEVERCLCASNAYCLSAERILSFDVAFKNLQIKIALIGIMLLVYVYRVQSYERTAVSRDGEIR